MFNKVKEVGAAMFGWIIPAIIAIGAVVAMRTAAANSAKERRLKNALDVATQDFIDDKADDVVAANNRLVAATKKREQADAKAKTRLKQLANTSESMADSLDRYRRDRGLLNSSDAT